MTALFQMGLFKAHSGDTLDWKIECERLHHADWECLAYIAAGMLPSFGEVEGIPRGGLIFSGMLRPYITSGPLLIVDDVCSTGGSLEQHRNGRDAIGIVAFSRGSLPFWVTSVFTLGQRI